ncbi:MAG: biotin/lipoate A/B protein ligase family protein [Thermoplasmata archaeon]
MEELRYIPVIEADGPTQMATDEALLRSFDEGGSPPTLRFFRFKPSAITVGYAQDIPDVIDVDRCDEKGIPFVRRITGGGTVYHDYYGEITYSIVTDRPSGSIEDSFHHLLTPIIDTLIDYELDAVFKPYNDILVGGRKISGSAQRRGRKGMLQHGTLMYATDLKTLSEILILDEKKLRAKGAKNFLDLVTTMEDELGYRPEVDELIEDMKGEYQRYFDVKNIESGLTEKEEELVEFYKERYRSYSWNYNRDWDEL